MSTNIELAKRLRGVIRRYMVAGGEYIENDEETIETIKSVAAALEAKNKL